MGVTARGDARRLAAKLKGLKAGLRYGYSVPMVHPRLLPEDRDFIVRVLEEYAQQCDSSEAHAEESLG